MGTGREGTGTGTGGGLITLHSHPGSRQWAGMGPGYKASRLAVFVCFLLL